MTLIFRLHYTFLLFFISLSTHAEPPTLYWSITENSGFPIFQSSSASTSFKVNCFLQSVLLNKIIGKDTPDIFEKSGRSTFQEYHIVRNDDRVLSIRFDMEGCGAYCENYEEIFSFNSITGELLNVDELFNKEGFRKAKWIISQARNQTISTEISSVKRAIMDFRGPRKSDSTMLVSELNLYEECLQRRDSSYAYDDNFYVDESSVWFTQERCSNHATRAYDKIGKFYNPLNINQYTALLSEYGKYIFRLSNQGNVNKSKFYIYTGLIAEKYPIWFFVNTVEGSATYRYCYKKYGILVNLEKGADEKILALTEMNGKKNKIADVYLRSTADGFTGRYVKASGEELAFTVTLLAP